MEGRRVGGDGGCGKNRKNRRLTGNNLEDSSEEEAAALLQSEELAEEEDEGDAAEDDGQDHDGLDCLDPFCGEGGRSEQGERERQRGGDQ